MPLRTAATSTPTSSSGNDLTVGQECLPRSEAFSSVALTSGVLRLRFFTARKSETIANIRMRSAATAAAATPTLCRMGIYSVDGTGNLTLIGACANDTTLFSAAGTSYSRALASPSSVDVAAGSRYAFGALVVTAATAPTVLSGSTAFDAAELAVAPRMTANLTGQTDLPTSIAVGTLATTTTSIFGVITP